MIYRSLFFFVICAVYLGLASAAFAGAWTQKKGGYYLKVGAGYLNSTGISMLMASRFRRRIWEN